MEKKQEPDQRANKNDGAVTPRLHTRGTTKNEFKRTHDLTVIEVRETILHEDQSEDRGAEPFRNLIADLLRDNQPSTAIWLVLDPGQLQHVLREMKQAAPKILAKLAARATVAVVDQSSRYRDLLTEHLASLGSGRQQTLTAFPAADGDGYIYYGHFKPAPGQDWKAGPVCEVLKGIPAELDAIINELHLAHKERLTKAKDNAAEGLKQKKITVLALDNDFIS